MFQRTGSTVLAEVVHPKIWVPDFKRTADTYTKRISYEPDKYVYFRCRMISAAVPNLNGDFWETAELNREKNRYLTFLGKGLYQDHKSESLEYLKGKIFDVKYITVGEYVEGICGVDRRLDSELARKVEEKQAVGTSMGCLVESAVCSICGNEASVPADLCDHMNPESPNFVKGRKYAGKMKWPLIAENPVAYEINRNVTFTEHSIVTTPADPKALIFERISSKLDPMEKKALLYHLDGLIGILSKMNPNEVKSFVKKFIV